MIMIIISCRDSITAWTYKSCVTTVMNYSHKTYQSCVTTVMKYCRKTYQSCVTTVMKYSRIESSLDNNNTAWTYQYLVITAMSHDMSPK